MTTQVLNVNDPAQVFSHQVLEVFLGDPQRHLLIFTGIAVPRWESRGLLDYETVTVKLGRTVTQKPPDGTWSATVGLASINNTDSDFTFATDAVSIDVDAKGQLELIVLLAVQGDTSVLSSFSYQANVLVQEREVELESLLVSDNIGVFPPPDAPPGPPVFQFGSHASVPSGTGGGDSQWRARITLDGPATDPGVFVHLTSSDPSIAQVPQAFIPITGGNVVSADILAPDVHNDLTGYVDVTITATLHSVSKTAVITVGPIPR